MKLSRYLLAALLYALPTTAFAQCAGVLPAGYFCGNASSAGRLAAGVSPTTMFNRAFGTVNNAVLVTNGSAVPAFGTTLPTTVQGNITQVGTIATGVWQGTAIGASFGGAGTVNGLLKANGSGTVAVATMTGTANEVTVTNGNGAAANPIFSLPSALTFTGKTVTGGTFNSGAFNGAFAGTVAGTSGAFSGNLALTANANGTTSVNVNNNSAGNAASSAYVLSNGTVTNAGVYIGGTGKSAYQTYLANMLAVYTSSAAGMTFLVDAAGPINFSTNGAERLRISSTGVVNIASLASAGSGCANVNSAGDLFTSTCGTGLPGLGTIGQTVLNLAGVGTGGWFNSPCTNMAKFAAGTGFVGDGATDNSSAMSDLFTAINANTITCAQFGPGTYLVNTCDVAGSYTATISANRRFALFGSGISQTIFKFACTSGTKAFTFTFTGTQTPYGGNAITLQGFSMMAAKAGTGAGAAITINGNTVSGSASLPTLIRDVNIINDGGATTGWDDGILLNNASQVTIDNVTGASCNASTVPCYRGAFIKSTATAQAVTGLIIRHADSQFFANGVQAASVSAGRHEGIFISDSNFSFMTLPIDLNSPGTDAQITGTQVNGASGGIAVTGVDGGSINGGTQICDPFPAVFGTGNCIYINAQRWAVQGANVAPAKVLTTCPHVNPGDACVKYNGVVLGPLAQLNTVSGAKITNPDSGIWYQASSSLNKAYLNHVTNPVTAVGVDSGSSNYMKCNSADSSIGGSSGACP